MGPTKASKVKVTEINLVKEGMLLPPPADCCQQCAVKHAPENPHNQESLFYQYYFYRQHDRWPTWADAMAHCTPQMKSFWVDALASKGVVV